MTAWSWLPSLEQILQWLANGRISSAYLSIPVTSLSSVVKKNGIYSRGSRWSTVLHSPEQITCEILCIQRISATCLNSAATKRNSKSKYPLEIGFIFVPAAQDWQQWHPWIDETHAGCLHSSFIQTTWILSHGCRLMASNVLSSLAEGQRETERQRPWES